LGLLPDGMNGFVRLRNFLGSDFLTAFTPMIPAIDQFFEDVMVMVEDEKVRDNRLALLQRVAALAEGVADMSKLEGF